MNTMEQILTFCSRMKNEPIDVFPDAPMSEHCTFRIGGSADVLCVPHTEAALAFALAQAKELGLPVTILGNGSNVLISDDGIRGVVIKLMGGLTALEMRPDGRIWCEAGVPLKRLCTFALENDLTGLEFAYGIPGSVGGAVYMNADAYGGEIKDVLQAVRLLDIADGRIFEKPASELKMAYRNTPFTDKKHVIIGAYFSLKTGDRNAIREKMEELLGRRKASQPLNYPSAGSTFKRPAGAYAAALIDGCGLKGFGVGGAKVSEKHAGFVINAGGATCRDVRELMAEIKRIVYEKEGFVLEPEVELIGED